VQLDGYLSDFRWLIRTFPRLRVVFAHGGMPFFKALWPLVRRHPHAYLDLSSPHLSERFVRAVVEAVGSDKCLYGTDSPYGFSCADGSYDYARVRGWIDRLSVSKRDRRRILGENLRALIDV
jgi:predicted TIM-barrel fold metal-dependent hydrolase